MQKLFLMDLKNYKSEWEHSKRDSARAIITDDFSPNYCNNKITENTKVALVYSQKYNYYKFPGGGINKNEKITDALVREVSEETGLKVILNSVTEYGYVQRLQKSDYFDDKIFDQTSFYYLCKTENNHCIQKLDDYEKDEGFILKTVPIKEAISVNRKCTASDCTMICRETNVLQYLCKKTLLPTISFAHFLLDESEKLNPGLWKNHSLETAICAEKIALEIQKNGFDFDPEKAYILGLLHDIGRRNGHTYLAHAIDGYDYLMNFGFKDCAEICITHSFNEQKIESYIGKNDVSEERYKKIENLLKSRQFNDYDRLIQLLDATCGADGTKNLENRMNDVKKRYGYYPKEKWDKNFELKNYFEKLMKKNLYDVI